MQLFLLLFFGRVPPLPGNCILPPLSFLCVVSNHRILILLTGCARIKKINVNFVVNPKVLYVIFFIYCVSTVFVCTEVGREINFVVSPKAVYVTCFF